MTTETTNTLDTTNTSDDCVDATSPDSIASFMDTLAAEVCDQAVLVCYGAQDLVRLGLEHCHCDVAPLIASCDPMPESPSATDYDESAARLRSIGLALTDLAMARSVKAAEVRKAERMAKYGAEISAAIALGTSEGYQRAARLAAERDGLETDGKTARTVAGESPDAVAVEARKEIHRVAPRVGLGSHEDVRAVPIRPGRIDREKVAKACRLVLDEAQARGVTVSQLEAARLEAGAALAKK